MQPSKSGAGESDAAEAGSMTVVIVRRFTRLVGILRELGFEIAPILESVGLPTELFSDADGVISFVDYDRLLAACAETTGRDDLGFRLGTRLTPPLFGLVGLVAMNQPTVREAWGTIVHSFRMTGTGTAISLRVEDRRVIITYEIVAIGMTRMGEYADGGATGFVSLMREFCGPYWKPREARLFRKPVDMTPYRRFFECPILFNAPYGEIEFDEADLDLPVQGNDTVILGTLKPILDRALEESRQRFESGLRSVMASELARGKLNLDSVASRVGVSSRSLRRRLYDRGLSYAAMADGLKFERAKTLLSLGRPITHVAEALGYSDAGTFVRAFKQWAGVPPGAWRASFE
jgi:AraC-like DNA-binding protein